VGRRQLDRLSPSQATSSRGSATTREGTPRSSCGAGFSSRSPWRSAVPEAPAKRPWGSRRSCRRQDRRRHRGWGGDLQADAAERADPHGRGDPEAIGGWYPAHAATADTTITIVRGKSQAVGTAGSQERSGPINGDTPISSVRGHRDPGDGSSSASSHSGGHGRQSQARPNHTTAEQPHRRHEGEQT
jgi:hypothetical protein